MAVDAERSFSVSRWTLGPRILEIATLVVIGLALVVGAASIAASGQPPLGYLALALTAGGVLVGYRLPPVGLALLTLSAPVAAFVGADPTVNWSMSCFAALLFTLRGLPGLLVGLIVAAGNLVAVGYAAGTLDVSANPVASIAAFAAFSAAAIGSAIRGHRAHLTELERRTHDAISTRESMVERGVAEERLRIARDLHDSVGHRIAVVSMHLGAAQVKLPAEAADVRTELESARQGIQAVLSETQQILHVLRIRGESDPVQPTPDHHRIPELVETYRSAGMRVDANLTGLDRELSANTGAATFRIVQESLTNAHRHGDGSVTLDVAIDTTAVTITVVNPRARSVGDASPSGGNGLIGMRERAEAAGGTLTAQDDGRLFQITAVLPVSLEGSS